MFQAKKKPFFRVDIGGKGPEDAHIRTHIKKNRWQIGKDLPVQRRLTNVELSWIEPKKQERDS